MDDLRRCAARAVTLVASGLPAEIVKRDGTLRVIMNSRGCAVLDLDAMCLAAAEYAGANAEGADLSPPERAQLRALPGIPRWDVHTDRLSIGDMLGPLVLHEYGAAIDVLARHLRSGGVLDSAALQRVCVRYGVAVNSVRWRVALLREAARLDAHVTMGGDHVARVEPAHEREPGGHHIIRLRSVPRVAFLAQTIHLAHELGHLERRRSGAEILGAWCSLAEPLRAELTPAILAEEHGAWTVAEPLLTRIGFDRWSAFAHIRAAMVATYEAGVPR